MYLKFKDYNQLRDCVKMVGKFSWMPIGVKQHVELEPRACLCCQCQ